MTLGTPAPPAPWEPGEPLYSHPHHRGPNEGNYIRELFSLQSDEAYAVRVLLKDADWRARCPTCLVYWSPDVGPRCWVCGKPSPTYQDSMARAEWVREVSVDRPALLCGGPRDDAPLDLPGAPPRVLVPVVADLRTIWLPDDAPTEATVQTATYIRDRFDYGARRWLYTYKENA